jgi:hypothetical protein
MTSRHTRPLLSHPGGTTPGARQDRRWGVEHTAETHAAALPISPSVRPRGAAVAIDSCARQARSRRPAARWVHRIPQPGLRPPAPARSTMLVPRETLPGAAAARPPGCPARAPHRGTSGSRGLRSTGGQGEGGGEEAELASCGAGTLLRLRLRACTYAARVLGATEEHARTRLARAHLRGGCPLPPSPESGSAAAGGFHGSSLARLGSYWGCVGLCLDCKYWHRLEYFNMLRMLNCPCKELLKFSFVHRIQFSCLGCNGLATQSPVRFATETYTCQEYTSLVVHNVRILRWS